MGDLLGIDFNTRTLFIVVVFAFFLLFVIVFLDEIVDTVNQLKASIVGSGQEAEELLG